MLSPFAQQYLYSGRQNKRAASPNDGFGNLTQQNVTAGSAPSMSLTVNPANNRVTSAGSYDANGNQTTALNGMGIAYDAENRVTAQKNSRYFYNGSNQQVWKITGSIEEF